jgi:hypothetical protein
MSHFADMHQRIQHGPVEELKTFFQENKNLINQPLDDKNPPPLSYCIRYRHPHTQDPVAAEKDMCNAVQALINCGASVNTTIIDINSDSISNPHEYLPVVSWAQASRSVAVLDILMKNGTKINVHDDSGTILQHLIYRLKRNVDEHFLTLIEKALEHGANPYDMHCNKNAFDTITELKTWHHEPLEQSTKGCRAYKFEPQTNRMLIDLLNKAELLLCTKYTVTLTCKPSTKAEDRHRQYLIDFST